MSLRLRKFDITRHLDSEEAISIYLEEIIVDDPGMLIAALDDIARAKGHDRARSKDWAGARVTLPGLVRD